MTSMSHMNFVVDYTKMYIDVHRYIESKTCKDYWCFADKSQSMKKSSYCSSNLDSDKKIVACCYIEAWILYFCVFCCFACLFD